MLTAASGLTSVIVKTTDEEKDRLSSRDTDEEVMMMMAPSCPSLCPDSELPVKEEAINLNS